MGSGRVAVHSPSTTLRAVPLPELTLREESILPRQRIAHGARHLSG